jgi:hypothetical protein
MPHIHLHHLQVLLTTPYSFKFGLQIILSNNDWYRALISLERLKGLVTYEILHFGHTIIFLWDSIGIKTPIYASRNSSNLANYDCFRFQSPLNFCICSKHKHDEKHFVRNF